MKRLLAAAAALVLVWGCRAPDPRPTAEDPVCLAKGDLGCVRIRVDEKTPRAVHQGKTYYFCAESCRVEFEKEPGKFTGSSR